MLVSLLIFVSLQLMEHAAKIRAIGLRLRRLRDEQNLSQEELSYISNVSKPTIQRIEKAETAARLDVLISIAEALKMPLHDFVRVENGPN